MQTTRFLRWYFTLVTALGCSAAVAQAPAKPSLKPENVKQLDALLAEAVSKKNAAGAVALIAQGGKTLYLKGVGMQDAEARKLMQPDALFRIASMSKPITSIGAMILVDDGKLKLDDPVSKYIPEFKQMQVLVAGKDKEEAKLVPAERSITIKDLLTHTSGIPYRFMAPEPLRERYVKAGVVDGLIPSEETIADNVKRIAALPLAFQPGTQWMYGLNTDVLGRVIEVASSQPLDQFLQKRVFEPLKMKDTAFFPPKEKLSRLAAVYAPDKEKGLVRLGDALTTNGPLVYSPAYPYKGSRTYFSGGAGLISTAPDYARFLQMLLNGGELDGVRVLKTDTVKQILSNQIGDLSIWGGDKFGLGFGIVTGAGKERGPASPGTFTWGGFWSTNFWADPQKKLIGVLMTQAYPTPNPALKDEYMKRVYQAIE